MSATLQIQDTASNPLTSNSWGIIAANTNSAVKFFLANIGTDEATDAVLTPLRLGGSDGVDNVSIAPDVSGNPGTYQSIPLTLGTIAAGAKTAFWVKVSAPAFANPSGNPRQFDVNFTWFGT